MSIVVNYPVLFRTNDVKPVTASDFSYDGVVGPVANKIAYVSSDNGANWEIAILASGDGTSSQSAFKFLVNPGEIDIFIVGGGGTGKSGTSSAAYAASGGKGGTGGECKTFYPEDISVSRNVSYPVVIGTGGGSTTFDTLIALGGDVTGCTGIAGGIGASVGSSNSYSTDGTDGVYAFGAQNASEYSPSIKYGASGGGGSARRWRDSDYWTYRNKSNTYTANGGASHGGRGGGAGTDGANAGGAASAQNSGAGGGGGAGEYYNGNNSKAGGAGGSGIIIIRNHRTAA